MSSVCADQHKFLPFSPKKSLIRDIDIPPRKLLSRRAAVATAVHDGADMYSDSPRFSSAEEAFLQKFLPHNIDSDSDDGSDDSDPYSSDHFRMYEFKVRQCTRSRSHDWTDCPFAHPGEKARRRDPRRFHYSGTVCPEYRRGGCSRGDGCDFAHGVFECWLHPARYRTEACKDGKNCKRKVCFFAHTPRQLRILPVNSHNNNNDNNNSSVSSNHHISKNIIHSPKFLSPNNSSSSNNCCLFCHHCAAAAANNSTLSPTSTLFSQMSPPLSPPLSPAKRRAQAVSRYCDRFATAADNNNHHGGGGVVSYKDVVTELMSSLDGLNFIESNSPTSSSSSSKPPNLPWLDISLINSEDPYILSPSTHSHNHTPITTTSSSVSASSFSNGGNLLCNSKIEVNNNNSFFSGNHDIINGSSSSPDLAWVNELLM